MLDVICSALGAVLILFILSQQAEQSAQAELARKDEQIERMQRELMEAQKKLREQRNPGGLAVGMCTTSTAQVSAKLFDHGGVDDDRVDLSLNNASLRDDVSLPGREAPLILTLDLEPGPNYLGAQALNEGSHPPNTATVVIDPCIDGKPEHFRWDMKTGQKRHISIVRE